MVCVCVKRTGQMFASVEDFSVCFCIVKQEVRFGSFGLIKVWRLYGNGATTIRALFLFISFSLSLIVSLPLSDCLPTTLFLYLPSILLSIHSFILNCFDCICNQHSFTYYARNMCVGNWV